MTNGDEQKSETTSQLVKPDQMIMHLGQVEGHRTQERGGEMQFVMREADSAILSLMGWNQRAKTKELR